MKYIIFEQFLKTKGFRCINYIANGLDIYAIGRYYWSDIQIMEDGLSCQYHCDENDFERYKEMLTYASDCSFLK